MKKIIVISADTNDADYIKSVNDITDEKLESIKPVIEAIKNFKPYKVIKRGITWTHNSNYPCGEVYSKASGELSKDELYGHIEGFNDFDNLVPYSEYGIHTIEFIKVLIVQEEIQLL